MAADRVYKVLGADDWRAAQASGHFSGSPDDQRDGFIHLSAAPQLAGTLAKYFRDKPDLLLLAFEAAALGDALRWEPSRGGELFPHLYAPLPTALALDVVPLALDADGIPILPHSTIEAPPCSACSRP